MAMRRLRRQARVDPPVISNIGETPSFVTGMVHSITARDNDRSQSSSFDPFTPPPAGRKAFGKGLNGCGVACWEAGRPS